MPFGIDTFRVHIDQILNASWGAFRTWNGGQVSGGAIAGGEPVFVGRNFLGGDFIWGHAEITNAASEPDGARYPLGANDPSPEHPENLTLRSPLIAPIQAPHQPDRQQLTGDRGLLMGQIDADAICRRLVEAFLANELGIPASGLINVWLAVNPGVDFSVNYWAGWADTVNNFVVNGQFVPFRACILCRYVAGAGGTLQPDPHVVTALATNVPGMNTRAHGCWADATIWDNAPADLTANGSPLLDFNRFAAQSRPVLWRIARGFFDAGGAATNVAFDVDAVDTQARATDFMFESQQWQPDVPSLRHIGFSSTVKISDPAANCLQTTDQAAMGDNGFLAGANNGHFQVPAGPASVIGRYIRHNAGGNTMTPNEAQRLSDANIRIFTIWEGTRPLSGMGNSEPSLLDPREHPVNTWGQFTANIHKYIHYFNPDPDGDPATHDDAGTLDGTEAFQYCGNVLKQPPQTPVFFAIDFDPQDLPNPDPSALVPPPPPPPPAPPIPPNFPVGWPAPPNQADRKRWILTYFERIKAARDDYASHTGRFYLIGVYCAGGTLQWCYEQGIASHFWQAVSFGHTGSRPPRWPWYHANRWQYQKNRPAFCGVNGTDPDADWGDGGTWSLTDPLTQSLVRLERAQLNQFVRNLFPLFGNIQDMLGGNPQ